jgi:hypothetical protein
MREHTHSRLGAAAIAAVALLGAACADSGGEAVVSVSANPASIAVNGSSTITAVLTNDKGEPLAGGTIEWSNSHALLQAGNSVTDASGRVTATLSGDGSPGTAVVSAALVNSAARGQVSVRIGLD